jgi:hypothetical protein
MVLGTQQFNTVDKGPSQRRGQAEREKCTDASASKSRAFRCHLDKGYIDY